MPNNPFAVLTLVVALVIAMSGIARADALLDRLDEAQAGAKRCIVAVERTLNDIKALEKQIQAGGSESEIANWRMDIDELNDVVSLGIKCLGELYDEIDDIKEQMAEETNDQNTVDDGQGRGKSGPDRAARPLAQLERSAAELDGKQKEAERGLHDLEGQLPR